MPICLDGLLHGYWLRKAHSKVEQQMQEHGDIALALQLLSSQSAAFTNAGIAADKHQVLHASTCLPLLYM